CGVVLGTGFGGLLGGVPVSGRCVGGVVVLHRGGPVRFAAEDRQDLGGVGVRGRSGPGVRCGVLGAAPVRGKVRVRLLGDVVLVGDVVSAGGGDLVGVAVPCCPVAVRVAGGGLLGGGLQLRADGLSLLLRGVDRG